MEGRRDTAGYAGKLANQIPVPLVFRWRQEESGNPDVQIAPAMVRTCKENAVVGKQKSERIANSAREISA